MDICIYIYICLARCVKRSKRSWSKDLLEWRRTALWKRKYAVSASFGTALYSCGILLLPQVMPVRVSRISYYLTPQKPLKNTQRKESLLFSRTTKKKKKKKLKLTKAHYLHAIFFIIIIIIDPHTYICCKVNNSCSLSNSELISFLFNRQRPIDSSYIVYNMYDMWMISYVKCFDSPYTHVLNL
jgi:hypothetical protein